MNNSQSSSTRNDSRLYSTQNQPSISDFDKSCKQTISNHEYPLATVIEKNIPVYDLAAVSSTNQNEVSALQDEWYQALSDGPGVFVVKNFFQEATVLQTANCAFQAIIARERSQVKGDHFAAGGKNDRIWNSSSKHCLQDPVSFVNYYSNPWLAQISEAWLGPQYRITAQVNIVKPGGAPQISHRDYHLGFQTADGCARFPKGIQYASQFLTLQGAVAQTDMSLESGPTRFLPFSQKLGKGYLACRTSDFDNYFSKNWVSLPLKQGDGVFFNPALHHAAGRNDSNVDRSANLLQISSAFGKPMESIDAVQLLGKCWDLIKTKYQETGYSAGIGALISAVGEGYPFPTNLDRRPPASNGMAPSSEQDVIKEALLQDLSTGEVVNALQQMRADATA